MHGKNGFLNKESHFEKDRVINMFRWRITRYDPQYRDNRGAYLNDEWTDYSDIGRRTFEGKMLTREEYLKTENAYIQAVLLYMEDLNINTLRISCLEKDGKCPKKVLVDDIEIVKNMDIAREKLTPILQSILRNKFWGKFETEEMYVHFGYDYYMYVGSIKRPSGSTIEKIEQMGLFVEEYESPYLHLDE